MQLNQILGHNRPATTLIAWRGKQRLELQDFRRLILTLIQTINAHPNRARWALCFDDSFYFSAALLALFYCNKIPVIPGHTRESVLKEQAQDYDGLLTDLDLSLSCPIINVAELVLKPQLDNQTLPAWPNPEYLVLFTSGSTGIPKAIVKPVALMERESEILINHFSSQLEEVIITSTVSHQHLYGLTFRIFLPLLAGIAFDANQIEYHEQLQLFNDKNNILIASPAFLKRLDTHLSPLQCRLVFSAGGPLSYEHAQVVKQNLGVLPQEIYGSSETGVIATRTQLVENQVWLPFAGISVLQKADETIKITSPICEKEHEDSISDIIRIENQGFHLLGRKDRIVKIEEKRISLTEIEKRLTQLPEIDDAAVVVLTQENRINIGAVIVLSPSGKTLALQISESVLTRQFRQVLREWLEPIAIPRRWRVVENIPLNQQGKRTYIELQELFI